mgnify:CR=1 FL=1
MFFTGSAGAIGAKAAGPFRIVGAISIYDQELTVVNL